MPLSAPVVFPLFPIGDGGKCGCGHDKCARVGKHPAVAWGELAYGDEVPRPSPGAGAGLKTGAAPKGSGVFVIDLDSAEALDSWQALGGLEIGPTFTVQTPRGLHLYFAHPGFRVPNSAGSLAKGIDVRGDGGFVVAYGSPHKTGATYELVEDVEPAQAPAWLLDWLRAQKIPDEVQPTTGDVTDDELEYHRDLFVDACKRMPPSIEGSAGDLALWKVVQHGAHDLALPGEVVLDVVREHFDPRCVPPWGDELEERVRHKVRSAKTQSTKPRAEPLPPDLAHLASQGHILKAYATTFKRLADGDVEVVHRVPPHERALRVGAQNIARLKTGLPSVDKSTRGGILLRKVGVVGGAPGAGKTALLVRLGYGWLKEGVAVGMLASDEDADAILIRFGQLAGLSRDALETGDAAARAALSDWCKSVPLILADGDEDDATIESVSRELASLAGSAGTPSVLLVDSMQTARCEMDMRGVEMRTRINETVRVLKRAAKVDGHVVIASSELSKAAYRNKNQAENINALSAFKESGDIEYGVSLAIILISHPGANDLVDAAIVKNRLGAGKPEFLLRLDHERADVTETSITQVETADPLYFVKAEVISLIKEHGALGRQVIYGKVGGRKADVVKAINELLRSHVLHEGIEGIRFPLPGEPSFDA